jgi:hypothetical protein
MKLNTKIKYLILLLSFSDIICENIYVEFTKQEFQIDKDAFLIPRYNRGTKKIEIFLKKQGKEALINRSGIFTDLSDCFNEIELYDQITADGEPIRKLRFNDVDFDDMTRLVKAYDLNETSEPAKKASKALIEAELSDEIQGNRSDKRELSEDDKDFRRNEKGREKMFGYFLDFALNSQPCRQDYDYMPNFEIVFAEKKLPVKLCCLQHKPSKYELKTGSRVILRKESGNLKIIFIKSEAEVEPEPEGDILVVKTVGNKIFHKIHPKKEIQQIQNEETDLEEEENQQPKEFTIDLDLLGFCKHEAVQKINENNGIHELNSQEKEEGIRIFDIIKAGNLQNSGELIEADTDVGRIYDIPNADSTVENLRVDDIQHGEREHTRKLFRIDKYFIHITYKYHPCPYESKPINYSLIKANQRAYQAHLLNIDDLYKLPFQLCCQQPKQEFILKQNDNVIELPKNKNKFSKFLT